MMERNSSSRFLAEAALTIALAVVFSRIRLYRLPQGGSITLEIVPLLILALRWGLWRGIAAGAVAGILQWILGGYVVHPMQGILDYPLAYAVMGLAAIAPGRDWIGVVVACLFRIACHVASGVIFFASYAPEGMNPFLYSLVYNGSFMSINMVIALILVPLIMKRLRGL